MSSLPVSITRALPRERMRDLAIAGALVLWLVYTRIYWILQAAHLGGPVCPFYYFTGHPCPFCGGTRSFAYMWRGDLSDAVRLYPLGPALFAGTVATVGGLVTGAITGRTWTPRLTGAQGRGIGAGVVAAAVLSWALKVFVLGN
jgi:uncharacterized protein DUF2752